LTQFSVIINLRLESKEVIKLKERIAMVSSLVTGFLASVC